VCDLPVAAYAGYAGVPQSVSLGPIIRGQVKGILLSTTTPAGMPNTHALYLNQKIIGGICFDWVGFSKFTITQLLKEVNMIKPFKEGNVITLDSIMQPDALQTYIMETPDLNKYVVTYLPSKEQMEGRPLQPGDRFEVRKTAPSSIQVERITNGQRDGNIYHFYWNELELV
jgi:hypothetical protein